MAEIVLFSPLNEVMGDQELLGSFANVLADTMGGERDPLLAAVEAMTGT